MEILTPFLDMLERYNGMTMTPAGAAEAAEPAEPVPAAVAPPAPVRALTGPAPALTRAAIR